MGITDRELRHIRARYAGEVTMVDTWFGHLMRKLDTLGIAGETAVIFNADHGTCFDGPGDQGFLQKIPAADADGFLVTGGCPLAPPIRHFPLSRNAARIPLLIRMPGQKRQKRVKPIVQPWDTTATILDLFGVPAPDRMIGTSLLPLIAGRSRGRRKVAVVGSCSRAAGSDSGYAQAMDGTWSYTVWRGERGPALHHMRDDPNGRRNLVRKRPSVVRRLQREIRRFMAAEHIDPAWVEGYRVRP
jgi:arylsulfatase A-like enzyme